MTPNDSSYFTFTYLVWVYGAKTTVELCPPNPKELERATFTLWGFATRGTKSRSWTPGSGCSRLIVGWSIPVRIAWMVATASSPPAAPRQWPIIDLVLLILMFFMWGPNTFRRALISQTSPTKVAVAWALM